MMDLTNYLDFDNKPKLKTILIAEFRLDKKTIIQLLASDKIIVNENYYKVPERRLIALLISNEFGNIELELEQL